MLTKKKKKISGYNAASALAKYEEHIGCVKMYSAEEFYLQAAHVQAIILHALAPRDKNNLRGVNQIELKTHVVKSPQEMGKRPIKHKAAWSEMCPSLTYGTHKKQKKFLPCLSVLQEG